MEETQNLTSPPAPKNKSLIFLPIILLVAVLSGAPVYFWQQSRLTELESKLALQQQQIQSLEQENKTPSPTNTPIPDSRTLLTFDKTDEYLPCTSESPALEEINYDDPSTTVNYTNKDKELSIALPYNPNWGTKDFKLSPFEFVAKSTRRFGKEDGLLWGPLTLGEPCSVVRSFNLVFRPVGDVDQLFSEYSADTVNYGDLEKIKLSNGLDGLQYRSGGFCGSPSVEVIGRNFNYFISLGCRPEEKLSSDFELLRQVANSIELTN